MSSDLSVGTEVVPEATPKRRLPLWAWGAMALALVLALSVVRVVTGRNDIASSGTLSAALALAMPIAFAGLGGLWSERAGVVNIGLEGMMVLGTWGGAFGSLHGGPWMGIVGAAL